MMMKVERGNAAHPVNAILNYVYAALESQIRIKPTSCITFYVVHHAPTTVSQNLFSIGWSGTTKLAHPVLDFVKGRVFDPANFVIRTDGVCRLKSDMARRFSSTYLLN